MGNVRSILFPIDVFHFAVVDRKNLSAAVVVIKKRHVTRAKAAVEHGAQFSEIKDDTKLTPGAAIRIISPNEITTVRSKLE